MNREIDEFGFEAPLPLGHPGRLGLPQGAGTGPEIGEKVPDFTLPDQTGKLITFGQSHRKVVLVFFRSVVW